MKRVTAVISVLLALGLNAQAEIEIKHSGEFRARAAVEQGTNAANDSSSNFINHRFRLDTDFKVSDKLGAHLTLMHHANWGIQDVQNLRTSGDPNSASIDRSVDGESTILVNEAYATWQLSDQLMFQFGRGSFELADGSYVSQNDWENALTAFDGAAIFYDLEMLRIVAYGIKFADIGPNSFLAEVNDPEAYTIGLSADLKLAPEIFETMNIYVAQAKNDKGVILLDQTTGQAPSDTTAPTDIASFKRSLIRYGLTVGGTFAEMFNFNLSYHGYTGEISEQGTVAGTLPGETDTVGSMFDITLGATFENAMNLDVYVGYHMDSGTSANSDKNETYDSWYYNRHDNAGLMDVVGWGNLSYLKLGASIEPMDSMVVGLHYHMFTATEKDDLSNASLGTVATEDDIGSEIDLVLNKSYDGGFDLEARYGLFMRGDRFGTDVEDYQQFFLQGRLKF